MIKRFSFKIGKVYVNLHLRTNRWFMFAVGFRVFNSGLIFEDITLQGFDVMLGLPFIKFNLNVNWSKKREKNGK